MTLLTTLICILMPLSTVFEKSLKAEEFELEWNHHGEHIEFSLTAPTSGWVAVGFTESENIVGTNLIQGHVKDGEVFVQDQYVTGFGEHPPVEALAIQSCISNVSGKEIAGKTQITFLISSQQKDKLHFELKEGREIGLWLAYSVSDDFDHHSRKRIFRKIKL